MAENAGTIEASIRLKLDEMEQDALQANKMLNHYAKEFAEQGEKGGKMYVKGFGKGQVELNQKLNEMVSTFQGISPKMGALGDKLAKGFSKPIFSMIPQISAAFQMMLPIIGTIIAAVAAVGVVISKIAKAQKEFVDNVNGAKNAQTALTNTIKGAVPAGEKYNEMETRKGIALAKVRLAFEKMLAPIKAFGSMLKGIVDGVLTGFLEALGDITGGLATFLTAASFVIPGLAPAALALAAFSDSMKSVSEEEAEAVYRAQLLKEVNKGIAASYGEYNAALDTIAYATKQGAIDTEEANQKKLNATQAYLDKLIELRMESLKHVSENSKEVKQIDEAISAMIRERDALEELTKTKASAAANSPENLLTKATQEYEKALASAQNLEQAGHITSLEAADRRLSAENQYIETLAKLKGEYAEINSLTDIQADKIKKLEQRHAAEAKALKTTVDLEKQSAQQLGGLDTEFKDLTDTLSEEEFLASQIRSEFEKQLALVDRRAQLEKDEVTSRYAAVAASRESGALTEAEIAVQEELIQAIDRNAEARKKLLKTQTDDKNSFNGLMELFGAGLDAYNQITGAMMEISQKHAEEQIALIEKALEQTLAAIEEARTAELEAEGFIEAQSEEEFDKQIEAARKAGDEVLQYQLSRRKEEMEINEKYDEQAKIAEENAAREKANIEYQLAKEAYAAQMVNAISTGIQSVLNAYARGIEIPFAGIALGPAFAAMAGAAAAVQIGLLAANPPKPPQFASGGIVPGNKAEGDSQHILATAGELILNEAQQENVAGKMSGGETVLYVSLYLDAGGSEAIAKGVIRYANQTGAVLEQRAIRGFR